MLAFLSGWRGYVLAVVISAVAAGIAAWTAQGWRYQSKIADIERSQAIAIADAQELARKVEQARWQTREELINEAKRNEAAAVIDRDNARAGADRLRKELAQLQRRTRDTAIATRSKGQQGADPVGVLIELLTGLEQTGREVSEYADQLRVAGMTCEAVYDSLTSSRKLE